jgi:hypothetical protein
MLQFMKREDSSLLTQRKVVQPSSTGEAVDFETLVKDLADEPEHVECPLYEPLVKNADHGICSKAGVDIMVNNVTGHINMQIAKYFGDNVLMKNFKYYVEDCSHGPCEDIELIAPAVDNHHFPVGTSRVKVEGFDLAGNSDYCYRTVYVYDTEPPVFANPDSDVDGSTTVELDSETCTVEVWEVLNKYETVGWAGTATDNCDSDVEVVKKIYDDTGLVWDSTTGSPMDVLPMGPGTYHMEYVAIDDAMTHLSPPLPTPSVATTTYTVTLTTTHTVTVNLVDLTGPANFTGCYEHNMGYIVEAHETGSIVNWVPPMVWIDNCGQEDEGYVVEATGKHDGMWLPVGSHPVRYSFFDKYDNVMDEECIWTINVVQKAHPVEITCPPDVTVPTVEDAYAGIVTWDPPTATQGGVALDASQISYPQGVFSGMMFPFGRTTVTVNATGAITGDRIDEHLMYDECSFVVEVTDPFDPKVDGRMYRCKNSETADINAVPPFKICDGPEVNAAFPATYRDNFGYETNGVATKSELSCCESEENVAHACVPVPGSLHNKYCAPAGK